MFILRLLTVGLLLTSLALCDKLPVAPHLWDGNASSQSPFRLDSAVYFKVPGPPSNDGVIWKIVEDWSAGRPYVNITRTRLSSTQDAIRYISNFDEPNRYHAFLNNDNKWDASPVLGSHSLTHTAAYLGCDSIWFVQDKELVGIEYSSLPPSPANQAAWHQSFLQIARAIQAKVVASGESGGDTIH